MNSEQESTYVYLCTEPEYMYDTLYMYIYVQNLSVWTLDKTLHIYIYVKKLSVCTRLYICIIKCLYKTLYMFIYVQNLSVCTRRYICLFMYRTWVYVQDFIYMFIYVQNLSVCTRRYICLFMYRTWVYVQRRSILWTRYNTGQLQHMQMSGKITSPPLS